MSIYTKKGDTGFTDLYNRQRLSKSDPTITALGDLDELNCELGVANAWLSMPLSTQNERPPHPFDTMVKRLKDIQSRLKHLSSSVATPRTTTTSRFKLRKTTFSNKNTYLLESWIDEMSSKLPRLTKFILPGGSHAAAQLHRARAVCRRAERSLVAVGPDQLEDSVLCYVNRLSDLLFVAARYANKVNGFPDVPASAQ